MTAVAAAPALNDRVDDWLEEARRLADGVENLPEGARRAGLSVLDAFAAEDGVLPDPAAWARSLLADSLPKASPDRLQARTAPRLPHRRRRSPDAVAAPHAAHAA